MEIFMKKSSLIKIIATTFSLAILESAEAAKRRYGKMSNYWL